MKASISASAWATSSATARVRTSAATSSRRVAEVTILGNHDAAVAGPHGLLVLLRGRAPRARHPRGDADAPRTWRGSRRCRTSIASTTSASISATARRCGSKSSSTSSRPSRRASACRSGTSSATSRSSGTRTCARCSRSRQTTVRRAAAATSRSSRHEVHRQRRLRRPAARLRQPRELHDLRHREKRFEFKRVEYDIEAAANRIFAGSLERNFGHRLFIGGESSLSEASARGVDHATYTCSSDQWPRSPGLCICASSDQIRTICPARSPSTESPGFQPRGGRGWNPSRFSRSLFSRHLGGILISILLEAV